VALLCERPLWLKNGETAGSGNALSVVRAYEAFLQEKERRLAPLEAPSNGRQPARFTEVVVHDGSGYPRAEFGSGETIAVDLAFETDDPSLAFQLRVGADREDGVQAFAVDTRHEPWAPLSGRRSYRVRLLLPEAPIAQGEFRLYAFLGDEKALHLFDMRIQQPGFSVVAPDYVVGLIRPKHSWTLEEEAPRANAGDPAAVSAATPTT
jgi:hypothetical protein